MYFKTINKIHMFTINLNNYLVYWFQFIFLCFKTTSQIFKITRLEIQTELKDKKRKTELKT